MSGKILGSYVDKLGGIVFGALKGFLLVGVCILLLDFFGLKDVINQETRDKSVLYKQSESLATWAYNNKDSWIEKIDKSYQKVEKTVDDTIDDIL